MCFQTIHHAARAKHSMSAQAGLHSSYRDSHRTTDGKNWECCRALQGSDMCHGKTMKKKVQKSAKDCVALSLLLMEQLISSFLLPEEGSTEDPDSSVIHAAFLTVWGFFFPILVKKFRNVWNQVSWSLQYKTRFNRHFIFLCMELWNFLPLAVPVKSRTVESSRSTAALKIKKNIKRELQGWEEEV